MFDFDSISKKKHQKKLNIVCNIIQKCLTSITFHKKT